MTNTLKILYEDAGLVVIDKPTGITVNRSEAPRGQLTLADYLLGHYKALFSGKSRESEFYNRLGIVHRLDKDTSGVILVAKDESTFAALQSQFKERTVSKVYLALVWGIIKVGGSVCAPISRNPFNRMKFGIFLGGREARTSYKPVKQGRLGEVPVSS